MRAPQACSQTSARVAHVLAGQRERLDLHQRHVRHVGRGQAGELVRKRSARVRGGLLGQLGDQRVHFRVGVAGGVAEGGALDDAVGGVELGDSGHQFQRRGEVGDGDVVVVVAIDALERRGAVHGIQLDLDAHVLQRLLQVLAELGVLLEPGGGDQIHGEALAVLHRQARGVQQRGGLLGVERIARHVLGVEQRVAAEDRRDGGLAAAVVDGVDDELAVDGVQDGLAHLAAVDDVAALVEFGGHGPGRVLVAARVHHHLAGLEQAVDVAGRHRV
jgi:hypothetical protein